MVNKYVILADSNNINLFKTPKQLLEVNGEALIERTIRLLKENDVTDIIITSHDKRFDRFGVERYEPLHNDYDVAHNKGYWLDGYPIELLNEPICFLFGDVYYSEDAIRHIVNEDTDSTLFFCSYENKDAKYIKKFDEVFAYKVVDYELFKNKIAEVKEKKDKGLCDREPLPWELYRCINNHEDINEHKLTDNYYIINDETCDVDVLEDIELLKFKFEYSKKLSILIPYYKTYELTAKLLDALMPQLNDDVEVILIDDGCNEARLDVYKDINIIHLEQNKGGAHAENYGMKLSKGKYIAFIDSDDMIADDYVKTLLDAIDNHDEDAIFMDWKDIHTNAVIRRPNNYAPWKAIYKRSIVPFFDESYIYSYDVPFYDRLNAKDYTKYYLDKVLYYYNSNRPGNLTTEKEKILRKQKEENMIKVEVIENFTLERFDELEDIERCAVEEKGKLFKGDKFRCEKDLADYLLGNNAKNKVVVKVIEVEPEKIEEVKEEVVEEETEPTTEVKEHTKPKKKKRK